MPGVRDPVGGGVQASGEGRGIILPVAAEGKGTVQGVRGVDGNRIIGGAQDDTAWASDRGEMELEILFTGEDPRTYRTPFPAKGGPRSCPVK